MTPHVPGSFLWSPVIFLTFYSPVFTLERVTRVAQYIYELYTRCKGPRVYPDTLVAAYLCGAV